MESHFQTCNPSITRTEDEDTYTYGRQGRKDLHKNRTQGTHACMVPWHLSLHPSFPRNCRRMRTTQSTCDVENTSAFCAHQIGAWVGTIDIAKSLWCNHCYNRGKQPITWLGTACAGFRMVPIGSRDVIPLRPISMDAAATDNPTLRIKHLYCKVLSTIRFRFDSIASLVGP
jgi:hypothetical protein